MTIKACPCGGKAQRWTNRKGLIKIQCESCGIRTGWSRYQHKVEEIWNTRHYPTCATCKFAVPESEKYSHYIKCSNNKSAMHYLSVVMPDPNKDGCIHWTPKEEE